MNNLKLTGFDRATGAVEFINFDKMTRITKVFLMEELEKLNQEQKKDLTGSELSDIIRKKERIKARFTLPNPQVNTYKANRIN